MLWQGGTPAKKTEQARHRANKPKPFVPEFMKSQIPPSEINRESELHTTDDIRAILAQPRG